MMRGQLPQPLSNAQCREQTKWEIQLVKLKNQPAINPMNLNTKLTAMAATLTLSLGANAGEMSTKEVIVEPEAAVPGSAVSGTLSLDVNTHFISYGADVWGAGSEFRDALFNPSLELVWALPADTSFSLGTWWDVNGNAVSNIGKNIQEIDVWAGLSKSFGAVDATLLYQQWYYASDTEQIIDLILGFDAPFSPSITIHGRPDAGASGGDEGVVTVLGAGYDFEAGPVAFSIPVGVAFATDGFHGGDAGFAYTSVGLQGSMPLGIPSEYGEWALNAGITFYYTDDNVIPNNPDDAFLTGNIGISCAF